MTVEQYERLARDTEWVLQELLGEFNESVPDLTASELEAWTNHIMSTINRNKVQKSLKDTKAVADDIMDDFHVSVGYVMHHLHQQYSEILKMPIRLFLDLLEDLPVITGQKPYDPKRKSERIDGEAIGRLKGEL